LIWISLLRRLVIHLTLTDHLDVDRDEELFVLSSMHQIGSRLPMIGIRRRHRHQDAYIPSMVLIVTLKALFP
jgi:hypothetical protein